jgi:hypothetical protein
MVFGKSKTKKGETREKQVASAPKAEIERGFTKLDNWKKKVK